MGNSGMDPTSMMPKPRAFLALAFMATFYAGALPAERNDAVFDEAVQTVVPEADFEEDADSKKEGFDFSQTMRNDQATPADSKKEGFDFSQTMRNDQATPADSKKEGFDFSQTMPSTPAPKLSLLAASANLHASTGTAPCSPPGGNCRPELPAAPLGFQNLGGGTCHMKGHQYPNQRLHYVRYFKSGGREACAQECRANPDCPGFDIGTTGCNIYTSNIRETGKANFVTTVPELTLRGIIPTGVLTPETIAGEHGTTAAFVATWAKRHKFFCYADLSKGNEGLKTYDGFPLVQYDGHEGVYKFGGWPKLGKNTECLTSRWEVQTECIRGGHEPCYTEIPPWHGTTVEQCRLKCLNKYGDCGGFAWWEDTGCRLYTECAHAGIADNYYNIAKTNHVFQKPPGAVPPMVMRHE